MEKNPPEPGENWRDFCLWHQIFLHFETWQDRLEVDWETDFVGDWDIPQRYRWMDLYSRMGFFLWWSTCSHSSFGHFSHFYTHFWLLIDFTVAPHWLSLGQNTLRSAPAGLLWPVTFQNASFCFVFLLQLKTPHIAFAFIQSNFAFFFFFFGFGSTSIWSGLV